MTAATLPASRCDTSGKMTTTMQFRPLVLWLLTAALLLFLHRATIIGLDTTDPDDALRIVQVRDLLGGQAWWDITQHRINPAGGGGLMHWSRIVDAPLAFGVAALTPLVGTAIAERIVFAVWPLLLLAPLFGVLRTIGHQLGDTAIAAFAPLLLTVSTIILFQFNPVRVDHHGWQILLSGILLTLTLRPADARTGIIAGVVSATHLAISLEGLPTVALFAGIMAVEWMVGGTAPARRRLIAYLISVAIAACLAQYATRGPGALVQTWCDALSAPYLAALGVAAGLVLAGAPVVDRLPATRIPAWLMRGVVLGCAGIASLAALLMVAPTCAQGPFATLDPLVVQYWYSNVREGLPVWAKVDGLVGFALAPTLVGLIGTIVGLRAANPPWRRAWLILLAALAGAALVSLFVLRAMSTAQLFALPGCVVAGFAIWTWARSLSSTVPRIIATVVTLIAAPPFAGLIAAFLIGLAHTDADQGIAAATGPQKLCVDPAVAQALDASPATTILAPLDLGPHILQRTHHSVVATGHHRNNAAMARVIRVFAGPPEQAEAIARATGATMLVACPSAQEFENFRTAGPDVLASQLNRGRPPSWLEPVALPRGVDIGVWRIVTPHDGALPAPPTR